MNTTPISTKANSVSDDIASLLEQSGIAIGGKDMFITVEPDQTESQNYFLIVDTSSDSFLSLRLDATIGMQTEFVEVQSYSKEKKGGREMLERVFKYLHGKGKFVMDNKTNYEIILALSPIRLLGLDKNRGFVHTVIFKVIRKENS